MANGGKKKEVVVRGVSEGLDKIPFHRGKKGIERILLLNTRLSPAAPLHIAGHLVGKDLIVSEEHTWNYTERHAHNFDEVNIVWSETGELIYRFEVEGEEHYVRSPSAVLIPAGLRHRAEAVEGQGSFFCILLDPNARKIEGDT